MDKTHIFIADDNKPFLDFMERFLQREGYKVTVLQASNNAYQEIKQASPDLIILDMNLGRADISLEVLGLLELNTRTTRTPVIVCTADQRILRELKDILDDLGCYVVQKPFELDNMLTTIQHALNVQKEPKALRQALRDYYTMWRATPSSSGPAGQTS